MVGAGPWWKREAAGLVRATGNANCRSSGLTVELEAGRIGGQADARRYLAETWGVIYKSVNGISYQFKRRKVKWKTGRRRHAQADAAAQAAFRQTSPRD